MRSDLTKDTVEFRTHVFITKVIGKCSCPIGDDLEKIATSSR